MVLEKRAGGVYTLHMRALLLSILLSVPAAAQTVRAPVSIPPLLAGSISDPQGFMAQKLGFRVLHDFLKSDLPFANISVITGREYALSHEEIVTRLLKAQMEGIRYLLSYPDVARKTISKYARIKDPEVLDYTLRLFSGSYSPSLLPEPEGMKTVYEGLADQRSETKNLDVRAYIYDSVIRKIHQSGFPAELDRLYPGTRQ